MNTFNTLGLAEPLLKALAEESYTIPTPIQLQAIPPVLAGHDLLGIAQTGTGKTAAYALPILHRLAADRRPAPRKGTRVLVLSPTRELATQIGDSFRTYGRHLGFKVAVVFGGVGHRPQIDALNRGVDVLVATPGRLIDHIDSRNAELQGTEILVLDEADQMLDLGFVIPIRKIVARLSQKRQSLFFSATMPSEIGKLADEMLRSPKKVSVAPTATTVESVTQRVINVERAKKRALLVELLADNAMSRTLVFTRTKRGADRVARHLEAAGIDAAAIHGNKSQNQREAALAAFKDAKLRVLVATDIAARGIDIDRVTHVVNFDMPDVAEAYVHRIGRTARAGEAGIAISLVDGEERDQLRAIERLTRQRFTAEDRRNDTGLRADKTPDKSPRSRGGRPGEQRRPQANGGKRSWDPQAVQAVSVRPRHERPSEERPGQQRASQGRPHGAKPHQPARAQHKDAPRSGDTPGLGNIAFMKRDGERAQKPNGHAPKQSHGRPSGGEPGRFQVRRGDNRGAGRP